MVYIHRSIMRYAFTKILWDFRDDAKMERSVVFEGLASWLLSLSINIFWPLTFLAFVISIISLDMSQSQGEVCTLTLRHVFYFLFFDEVGRHDNCGSCAPTIYINGVWLGPIDLMESLGAKLLIYVTTPVVCGILNKVYITLQWVSSR